MKILAQESSLLDKMVEEAKESVPISKSTVARIVTDTEMEARMRQAERGDKPHVQIDEKYIKIDGKNRKTRYVTATVFARIYSHGKRNRLDHRVLVSGVELGKRLDFDSEYASDRWHIAHFLSSADDHVRAS